jgi:hypothetical protein
MKGIDKDLLFAYEHLNRAVTELENDGNTDTILDSLYACLGTLRDLVDATCDPDDVELDRDPWEGVQDSDE